MEAIKQKKISTDLSRLCNYYLSCMGQSELGVSLYATSSKGELDYAELSELPADNADFFDQAATQQVLGKIRKEQGRWELFLGYPVSVRSEKAGRTGREVFKVEPVLLFPVEMGTNDESPRLDLDFPIVNQSVVKSFTNVDRDQLMDALIQLEDDLGIGDKTRVLPIDELAQLLYSKRAEWPWLEAVDPKNLSSSPALAETEQQGIYNRAIALMAQRSPYTAGLEVELKKLANLSPADYRQTALGQWLHGITTEEKPVAASDLLEVLPMNLEQRDAVASALSKPLTIITGPPGTGKSQVVTNLMINAAWQNKKVLFASKNNQAVDVVNTRVNGLGSRPLLLRVGAQAYQTRLAEFLMSFQAASATQDDQEIFDKSLHLHRSLKDGIARIDREVSDLIRLRNEVDELEQLAEGPRNELPANAYSVVQSVDLEEIKTKLLKHSKAMLGTLEARQPALTRLLWPLIRSRRIKVARRRAGEFAEVVQWLEVGPPKDALTSQNYDEWQAFSDQVGKQLSHALTLRKYQNALRRLQQAPSLEELDKRRIRLLGDVAENSVELWEAWLNLQPQKIDQEARQLLNKYTSLLKMVIDAGSDSRLAPSVFSQYSKLSDQVAHLLPCWAATSLSMRGRVPFEAGFFDLVVFDEASQCDIASALPLLYRAKRAAIIGDPEQLRHISGLKQLQDQQLLAKHVLVQDYPHWSYSVNSLFDLAAGLVGPDSVVRLLDHHRSHADIIQFSNDEFYEGRLRVATDYQRLHSMEEGAPGIFWFNVKGSVSRPASGGSVNKDEARGVLMALRRLVLERGYSGSIGVVSPFRGQVNAIRVLVQKDHELSEALAGRSFLVDTVHSFQGDERDVMIFSPVFSEGMAQGSLSFLRNNGNLFNVAITRARAHVIVVGDLAACASGEISYLASFADYVNGLVSQDKAEESLGLTELGEDYPEVSNPESVSIWEKVLYSALFDADIQAIPQYRVEKYLLDFALFRGSRKLNIEVDGERYHRNWTGELCRRDQLRNQRMFELGWDVMRFWVYEVRDDIEGCLARVQTWLELGD